jgi:hypothetical protein
MNDNLTRQEIAHYVALFFFNYEKNDFLEAYKSSDIGKDYVWSKLQDKIKSAEMGSASAVVSTFLNLDDANQALLVDYILNKKYAASIAERREWNNFLQAAMEEHLSEQPPQGEEKNHLNVKPLKHKKS